jgi:hypothetical protein
MSRPTGYLTLEYQRRPPTGPGPWPAFVCFGLAAVFAAWWWC